MRATKRRLTWWYYRCATGMCVRCCQSGIFHKSFWHGIHRYSHCFHEFRGYVDHCHGLGKWCRHCYCNGRYVSELILIDVLDWSDTGKCSCYSLENRKWLSCRYTFWLQRRGQRDEVICIYVLACGIGSDGGGCRCIRIIEDNYEYLDS